MVFKHTNLKMAWILHQINQKDGFFTFPPPLPPPLPPPSSSPLTGTFHKDSTSSSSTKISPAVLFIIVILAVLFFISGLLHLLVRFLIKHPSSSPSSQSNGYPEISTSDALQRQLQQLFHLHDSGLDQAFIDALPVFIYKEIVGLKEPFDCAVCLCEFNEKDKLRLLPTCSHAFHINCIDTWLLSNSSCPLCRGTLFSPGFSIENPVFDFDDPREEDGCSGNVVNGFSSGQKTIEIEEVGAEKGIFPVRLGKFRRLNDGTGEAGGETSSSNLDARRCYSMGSYQYLLGDMNLRVALNNGRDDRNAMILNCGDRGDDSSLGDGDLDGKKISIGTKTDSYSVSKIWLWSKKGKFASSSNNPSINCELPWMGRTQGDDASHHPPYHRIYPPKVSYFLTPLPCCHDLATPSSVSCHTFRRIFVVPSGTSRRVFRRIIAAPSGAHRGAFGHIITVGARTLITTVVVMIYFSNSRLST